MEKEKIKKAFNILSKAAARERVDIFNISVHVFSKGDANQLQRIITSFTSLLEFESAVAEKLTNKSKTTLLEMLLENPNWTKLDVPFEVLKSCLMERTPYFKENDQYFKETFLSLYGIQDVIMALLLHTKISTEQYIENFDLLRPYFREIKYSNPELAKDNGVLLINSLFEGVWEKEEYRLLMNESVSILKPYSHFEIVQHSSLLRSPSYLANFLHPSRRGKYKAEKFIEFKEKDILKLYLGTATNMSRKVVSEINEIPNELVGKFGFYDFFSSVYGIDGLISDLLKGNRNILSIPIKSLLSRNFTSLFYKDIEVVGIIIARIMTFNYKEVFGRLHYTSLRSSLKLKVYIAIISLRNKNDEALFRKTLKKLFKAVLKFQNSQNKNPAKSSINYKEESEIGVFLEKSLDKILEKCIPEVIPTTFQKP